MEAEAPLNASSQSVAQEKAPPEKENEGTIHCKVLDMKVKIDFNDKRSKFIQLLSLDDEEEVQTKSDAPCDRVQEDTTISTSIFNESAMEEELGKQENDTICDDSNKDGETIQETIHEDTASVIKEDDSVVVSEINPDDKSPKLVEKERIPDKQLFWAGFSVKPDTGVDIEEQVFKKIPIRIEATKKESDVLAVCHRITDDLARIQDTLNGIVLKEGESTEMTEVEGTEDSVEEKQLKSVLETEQAWTGNQYRQIINGTVYYFDNSDTTKKSDQADKEAEVEVNNNTVIDGKDFLENLKSKWMLEPGNEESEATSVDNAASSEYIVCDPSEYGIVEQIGGKEATEQAGLCDGKEKLSPEDPTSSRAGDGSIVIPDQKIDNDGNWCTKKMEENNLAAINEEKGETVECSPTAATEEDNLKSLNGERVDPPVSPILENNQQRQARPNSAKSGLEEICNNDVDGSIDGNFTIKQSEDSDTKDMEVQLEDITEDDLPPEKPISISKMKNEACKDLNIKPMTQEKLKRPKSSMKNHDMNLDIKLYLAEEKSMKRPKSSIGSRGQCVERMQKYADIEMKIANNEKPTRPKSARPGGTRASPILEGKQKLNNRPQSCRQRGKEGSMTANFPSRNCKNIMELLTEADSDNLDFLTKREPVLPANSYNGKSSVW